MSEGGGTQAVNPSAADLLRVKRAKSPQQNGVFSVQNKHQPNNSSPSNISTGGTTKPPRKPTPAHVKMYQIQRPPQSNGFRTPIVEVNEIDSDSGDDIDPKAVAMIPQHIRDAAYLSTFLSSSTDDSDEQMTEAVITDVYRDPLDVCMEGIEDLATLILRTGRLSIQGEPGDMSKVQPALFGLQAIEKEIPQLLPQLLQTPFFSQCDQDSFIGCWDNMGAYSVVGSDSYLQQGRIRLCLPVDTAIYHLLHSHSAKAAKQAEELINTALASSYSPVHSQVVRPQMPPMIFRLSISRPQQRATRTYFVPLNGFQFSELPEGEEDSGTGSSLGIDRPLFANTSSSTVSEYSTTKSEQSNSVGSLFSTSTSSSSIQENGEKTTSTLASSDGTEESGTSLTSPVAKQRRQFQANRQRSRKMSHILNRPRAGSSGSDISDIEYGAGERRLIPDDKTWNTSIVDNNMIIAQYGDSMYPLLMWNPALKLDFRLCTSIGILSGTVTGIDPHKPVVSLKIVNDTSKQIAFSIRCYRQSTIFKSHVVFPKSGLHVISHDQCWEDNVEFYPKNLEKNELFVIDLFLCTLDETPSWNVIRKYAIMKAKKSSSTSSLGQRRPSKRRPSNFHMPGTKDQKEENLKMTLSHGLQCVVKGKLEEAEVIFTQALYLPDYQRVPLKAFVYICLAVIANKRKKLGHSTSFIPALLAVNAADKLIEVCEAGPGSAKMPRMVQLVKQLKKELNIQKIMRDMRKKVEKRTSNQLEDTSREESEDIPIEGGTITYKSTFLSIPPNALHKTTRITLSTPDSKQLSSMLKATGWDETVTIVTALNVHSDPTTEHFEKPVDIAVTLAEDVNLPALPLVRLLQSNYLRHWQDITDDTNSKILLHENKIQITTDCTGWLAVTAVQLDISAIARLALRSLSIEPIILRFSVYGLMVPETRSVQIAVFVVPCKTNEDPIQVQASKPQHHLPIAFPHTVQAYPNERLRLEIQGCFEPDTSMGETDLIHELDVPRNFNQICEKWLKLTSHVETPLSGKLIISSCRNSESKWERLTEINISAKTGYVSSNSSSGSEH